MITERIYDDVSTGSPVGMLFQGGDLFCGASILEQYRPVTKHKKEMAKLKARVTVETIRQMKVNEHIKLSEKYDQKYYQTDDRAEQKRLHKLAKHHTQEAIRLFSIREGH